MKESGAIFTDQLGREIFIPSPPKRIISLVPSQTELLAALGLDQEVIGITKFCVHPSAWHASKLKIGGTKDFKPDIIRQLRPDLIIANKEENTAEGLSSLMDEFPVWISDVNTLEEALAMIRSLGEITGRLAAAVSITEQVAEQFSALRDFTAEHLSPRAKVAYFIWKDPWMIAGKNTFIDELLTLCGLSSVATRPRYPEITFEELQTASPDYVFLSSEPYPFKETDKNYFSGIVAPEKVVFVDGEFFSWYGSRLKNAPSYFKSVLKSLPDI